MWGERVGGAFIMKIVIKSLYILENYFENMEQNTAISPVKLYKHMN